MITQSQLDAWTTALRSGEFKQTSSYFEHDGKFCCLGVLCVVTGEKPVVNGTGNWPHVEQLLNSRTVHTGRLAHMNDSGVSFREIADWIDANLKVSK